MKVLFLLAVFQVLLFSQSSYFNISLYDETEFYVIFDNYNYSDPGNYAEFDAVSPGEHSLKVIKYDASTSAQGNIIFEGKVKIPAGYDIYAVIDEYNSLNIYKKVKYGLNRCYCDNRKKCGEKNGEKYKEPNLETTDECKYKIIRTEDFKDLKNSINNRSFESTNIDIVKTAVNKNYFSSQQVRELLSFFTFEASKLELAKYSYKRVCDQKNFFKVYDAFNFDSSVEELKNYISGK
ncbi:MAG TPA: DUF4476 domain-containing protein [Ignavibacteria bacterium]|jgi:hypothetical protein